MVDDLADAGGVTGELSEVRDPMRKSDVGGGRRTRLPLTRARAITSERPRSNAQVAAERKFSYSRAVGEQDSTAYP